MDYALKMTKKTYGTSAQNIDTTYFRQSMSIYLMNIHGVRDDQFNYANINKVLLIPHKQYIKKIGCYPQKVILQEYQNLSNLLSPSEKCHVCIIIMETKKQIELLFLSKAINMYLN